MSPPGEAFTPLAGRIALSYYSLEATGISCHQKKLCVGQGALVVVVTRSFCTAAYYSGMASLSLKKAQGSFLGAASIPDPNPELTSTAPSSLPACLDISSNSLSREQRWLFYTTDTFKKHFLERPLGFLPGITTRPFVTIT